MAFSVQMPALGESVTEGTVTRWLKQEGDTVDLNEPLVEVSTDKVHTEIPSPGARVLKRSPPTKTPPCRLAASWRGSASVPTPPLRLLPCPRPHSHLNPSPNLSRFQGPTSRPNRRPPHPNPGRRRRSPRR